MLRLNDDLLKTIRKYFFETFTILLHKTQLSNRICIRKHNYYKFKNYNKRSHLISI